METRRKQVGQQIKSARRAKKYRSQKAFAQAIGVHESSVANAETGSDRIGGGVYNAIETGLGWPINSISDYIEGRRPAMPGEDQDGVPEQSAVEAFEAAQVEAKRLQLGSMTLEDAARIADFVAEVQGDPRAGDDFLAALLRRRAEINSTESSAPEVG